MKNGGHVQMAAHEAAAELGWDKATQAEYEGFLAGWWACWKWLTAKPEEEGHERWSMTVCPDCGGVLAGDKPHPNWPECECST